MIGRFCCSWLGEGAAGLLRAKGSRMLGLEEKAQDFGLGGGSTSAADRDQGPGLWVGGGGSTSARVQDQGPEGWGRWG